jgi:jumonji domain-containing protein 7
VCSSRDGRYNHKPVQLRGEADEFSVREMPFGEAAKLIAGAAGEDQLYIRQQSVPEKFPELMEKLKVPAWIGDQAAVITLWFGGPSVTQLHYDGQNNFFAQLHGNKEFIIFSPQDTAYLHPFPIDSGYPHVSHVHPDRPDTEQYPAFSLAKPIRFTMQPGELLFLPAFWWHWVRARDVSISINFWWPVSMAQYVAAPNSFRSLYRQYAVDRLCGARKSVLAPQNLDFASAAALLLSHGVHWAAALLALADFDEAIGKLCHSLAITRPTGCALSELPKELAALKPKLAAAYDVTQAFTRAISLATQIGPDAQSDIGGANIRSLLELSRTLHGEHLTGVA